MKKILVFPDLYAHEALRTKIQDDYKSTLQGLGSLIPQETVTDVRHVNGVAAKNESGAATVTSMTKSLKALTAQAGFYINIPKAGTKTMPITTIVAKLGQQYPGRTVVNSLLVADEWAHASQEASQFTIFSDYVSSRVAHGDIVFGDVDPSWVRQAPFRVVSLVKRPRAKSKKVAGAVHTFADLPRDNGPSCSNDDVVVYFNPYTVTTAPREGILCFITLSDELRASMNFWKKDNADVLTPAALSAIQAQDVPWLPRVTVGSYDALLNMLVSLYAKNPGDRVVNGTFKTIVFTWKSIANPPPNTQLIPINNSGLARKVDELRTSRVPILYQRIPREMVKKNPSLAGVIRIFKNKNVLPCVVISRSQAKIPNIKEQVANRSLDNHFQARTVRLDFTELPSGPSSVTLNLFVQDEWSDRIEKNLLEIGAIIEEHEFSDSALDRLDVAIFWLQIYAVSVDVEGVLLAPVRIARDLKLVPPEARTFEMVIDDVQQTMPEAAISLVDKLLSQTPFRLVVLGNKGVGKSALVETITEAFGASRISTDEFFEKDEALPQFVESLSSPWITPLQLNEGLTLANDIMSRVSTGVLEQFNEQWNLRTVPIVVEANLPVQVMAIGQRCVKVLFKCFIDTSGVVAGSREEKFPGEELVAQFFKDALVRYNASTILGGGAVLWSLSYTREIIQELAQE